MIPNWPKRPNGSKLVDAAAEHVVKMSTAISAAVSAEIRKFCILATTCITSAVWNAAYAACYIWTSPPSYGVVPKKEIGSFGNFSRTRWNRVFVGVTGRVLYLWRLWDCSRLKTMAWRGGLLPKSWSSSRTTYTCRHPATQHNHSLFLWILENSLHHDDDSQQPSTIRCLWL